MFDQKKLQSIFNGDRYLESFLASLKDFMSLRRMEFGDLVCLTDKEKLENIRQKFGNEVQMKLGLEGYMLINRRAPKQIATDIYDLVSFVNSSQPTDIQKLFTKTSVENLEISKQNNLFESLIGPLKIEIDSLKRKCSQLETENIDMKRKYEELNAKVASYDSQRTVISANSNYANVFKSLSTPLGKRPSIATEDSNDDVFSVASSKKFRPLYSKAVTLKSSNSAQTVKSVKKATKDTNVQNGSRQISKINQRVEKKLITKPKARKQNGFRGQNEDKDDIAPKKYIHLFVGRVKSVCKRDEVYNCIKDFLTIEELKELESKSSRYKCFYLKVPFDQKELAYDPKNWPNNVLVARYHFPRKDSKAKAQETRGEDRADLDGAMEVNVDQDCNTTITRGNS
jgi:predicted Zn-ribbon and HTH transcriptional regulator